jgi:tRNA(fMet)-specific endonuclease VapC
MKKIILDTNAYSAFLSGNEDVFSSIKDSEIIYISAIVIGELFAGFYGGNKFKKNKEILNAFISKPSVQILSVGFETAEVFGEIKSELKRKGTPIPVNDLWLAANAIEYGAKLITFDKHFLDIPGLRLWQELKDTD